MRLLCWQVGDTGSEFEVDEVTCEVNTVTRTVRQRGSGRLRFPGRVIVLRVCVFAYVGLQYHSEELYCTTGKKVKMLNVQVGTP